MTRSCDRDLHANDLLPSQRDRWSERIIDIVDESNVNASRQHKLCPVLM